jgi:hypothetical protein
LRKRAAAEDHGSSRSAVAPHDSHGAGDLRRIEVPALAVGVVDVRHRQRDHLHAVAVAGVVAPDLVVGRERAGQHDPDPALLEHVARAVAHAGLESGVGDLAEAERVDVEVGRLQGVADVQLDMVDAVQRHEVVAGLGGRGDDGLGAHGQASLVV